MVRYQPPGACFAPDAPDHICLLACVTNAMAALSEQGYFCRAHWGISLSDAVNLVPDERADKWVVYHAQDTHGALNGRGLALAWDGDPAVIRAALEANDLTVEHDGTKAMRFIIQWEGK